MPELPLITIITPSYNQACFIEQTIESVLDQKYPCLQYIVMDGGSTDGTQALLRKYDRHLEWFSERDRGQSHAVNKGLRLAAGEIVAFINSDDYYEPGALWAAGGFFAAHPDAAWLTGKCRTVDETGREIRRPVTLYKHLWLRLRSYRALQVLNYVSQPATFWSRKLLPEIGYLDEGLRYTMDYDYWLRIGKRYPLRTIDRCLACFRIHSCSKSGTTAHLQFDEELETARRHSQSRRLLALHRLHRAITVTIYRHLLIKEDHRPMPAPLIEGT